MQRTGFEFHEPNVSQLDPLHPSHLCMVTSPIYHSCMPFSRRQDPSNHQPVHPAIQSEELRAFQLRCPCKSALSVFGLISSRGLHVGAEGSFGHFPMEKLSDSRGITVHNRRLRCSMPPVLHEETLNKYLSRKKSEMVPLQSCNILELLGYLG